MSKTIPHEATTASASWIQSENLVAVVLPGVPESVSAARAMVRRQLGTGHPAADTAAVCVSELATNAIAYTRSGLPGGTFAVHVQAVPGGLEVRVLDNGARTEPALADPAPGAEHGYGLRIVAALADAWGTESLAAGRATWCRITLATDQDSRAAVLGSRLVSRRLSPPCPRRRDPATPFDSGPAVRSPRPAGPWPPIRTQRKDNPR